MAYLFEAGFSGIEERTGDDGGTVFQCYFRPSPETPDPVAAFVTSIGTVATGYGVPAAVVSEVEDVPAADWEHEWRRGLGPVESGVGFVVRPSWTHYENVDDRIEILIDPMMAFGTGGHETTRLCLAAMEGMAVGGCAVTDAGCGSGVLSIAAARLGALAVYAFDNDPFSVGNAIDNIRINGVDHIVTVHEADLGTVTPPPAGVLFANMISGILLRNVHRFPGFLVPGGMALFSGILDTEEAMFTDALVEAGFRVLEVDRMGEWVAVTAVVSRGDKRFDQACICCRNPG